MAEGDVFSAWGSESSSDDDMMDDWMAMSGKGEQTFKPVIHNDSLPDSMLARFLHDVNIKEPKGKEKVEEDNFEADIDLSVKGSTSAPIPAPYVYKPQKFGMYSFKEIADAARQGIKLPDIELEEKYSDDEFDEEKLLVVPNPPTIGPPKAPEQPVEKLPVIKEEKPKSYFQEEVYSDDEADDNYVPKDEFGEDDDFGGGGNEDMFGGDILGEPAPVTGFEDDFDLEGGGDLGQVVNFGAELGLPFNVIAGEESDHESIFHDVTEVGNKLDLKEELEEDITGIHVRIVASLVAKYGKYVSVGEYKAIMEEANLLHLQKIFGENFQGGEKTVDVGGADLLLPEDDF